MMCEKPSNAGAGTNADWTQVCHRSVQVSWNQQ